MMNEYIHYYPTGDGSWAPSIRTKEKPMTDYNLDTVELKNAEFTANVGDKQITAKVVDKDEAEKAEQKKNADMEASVPFDV